MGSDLVTVDDVESQLWFQQLVEDCKDIIVETEFIARWALIEGYHQLGLRILEEYERQGRNLRMPDSELVSRVSIGLNRSRQTIHRAVQFARKFPDLAMLPEGKNVTWREICNEYLPTPKEAKETPALPEGKFRVIYADPPWPVGSVVMDKWESPIDDKYPTMTIEEIKALPVADLAGEGCSLFLWTTHTFLPDALNVVEAWGFKYHCLITWDKGGGWTQFGFHKRSEFLLFAYKDKLTIDEYGDAIPTVINEPKGEHSKKPDSIRDMIAAKTEVPRLEMFARGEYDGWIVWGNEAHG